MTTIQIQKYYPKAEPLKHLIKYYWVFDSGGPVSIHHKILPFSNIDLIFNLRSPITYERDGRIHKAPGSITFTGLSKRHMVMHQRGPALTIGVAFFPLGFYPFFRIPVSEFRCRSFGLETILGQTAVDLESRLREVSPINAKIERIEAFLLDRLDWDALPPRETCRLLDRFHSCRMRVHDFCREHGVHPRTLERMFGTYVGATPKLYFRLTRFTGTLNALLERQRQDLTALAHDADFFDQAHFIKDFASFAGASPSKFLREKGSVKQIMEQS